MVEINPYDVIKDISKEINKKKNRKYMNRFLEIMITKSKDEFKTQFVNSIVISVIGKKEFKKNTENNGIKGIDSTTLKKNHYNSHRSQFYKKFNYYYNILAQIPNKYEAEKDNPLIRERLDYIKKLRNLISPGGNIVKIKSGNSILYGSRGTRNNDVLDSIEKKLFGYIYLDKLLENIKKKKKKRIN